MGNGYAITAVVGKEEIMQEAQKTFIVAHFGLRKVRAQLQDIGNNGERKAGKL